MYTTEQIQLSYKYCPLALINESFKCSKLLAGLYSGIEGDEEIYSSWLRVLSEDREHLLH